MTNYKSDYYFNSKINEDSLPSKSRPLISQDNSKDDNNLLFSIIKELAINNDLNLPSKDKDFFNMSELNNFEFKNVGIPISKENIDIDKLNKIMKIISKYNE